MMRTMRSYVLWLSAVILLCGTSCRPVLAAKATSASSSSSLPSTTVFHPPGRYERFLEKVFDRADVDRDGRMTLSETYEWVLRLYVQINRQAPINPPTLTQVQRIVTVLDTDRRRGTISRAEFRAVAEVFVRRAAARVAANKMVTLVLAPLLAEACLHWFQRQAWLYEMVVIPFVPPLVEPIVTNPVLGRTVLIAVLVSILGGYVMGRVNEFLDWLIERREALNTDR